MLPAHERSTRLALLVALAATLGFALIAIAVAADVSIIRYDLSVARWLHAHAQPVLIAVMRLVSGVNGVAGTSLMAVVLALWLRHIRAWAWFETVLLAIPGVMVLNAFLKQVFVRPRPHFADPWRHLTSYSFPSGHVSQSTVFYGLLAAWLCLRSCCHSMRVMIVLAALLMIGAVAASRMYLGAHYLSDVLAAFLEGVAWLAVCHLALSWLRRRNDLAGRG